MFKNSSIRNMGNNSGVKIDFYEFKAIETIIYPFYPQSLKSALMIKSSFYKIKTMIRIKHLTVSK